MGVGMQGRETSLPLEPEFSVAKKSFRAADSGPPPHHAHPPGPQAPFPVRKKEAHLGGWRQKDSKQGTHTHCPMGVPSPPVRGRARSGCPCPHGSVWVHPTCRPHCHSASVPQEPSMTQQSVHGRGPPSCFSPVLVSGVPPLCPRKCLLQPDLHSSCSHTLFLSASSSTQVPQPSSFPSSPRPSFLPFSLPGHLHCHSLGPLGVQAWNKCDRLSWLVWHCPRFRTWSPVSGEITESQGRGHPTWRVGHCLRSSSRGPVVAGFGCKRPAACSGDRQAPPPHRERCTQTPSLQNRAEPHAQEQQTQSPIHTPTFRVGVHGHRHRHLGRDTQTHTCCQTDTGGHTGTGHTQAHRPANPELPALPWKGPWV